SGGGQYDVSAAGAGMLAYLAGRATNATYPLQWLNASGQTEPLVPKPRLYLDPRLSPDGRLLVVSAGGLQGGDLYIFDPARRTETQLTFNGQSNLRPVWAPDSKHLVYVSRPANLSVLW